MSQKGHCLFPSESEVENPVDHLPLSAQHIDQGERLDLPLY